MHYQPKVTGAIEWLDPVRNRMSVLGQTIQLMQDTTYGNTIQPRNIEGFNVGDVISASGVAASDNVIRVSRIELELNAQSEVAGTINYLDANAQTFYLNELLVDYAPALFDVELKPGQRVVVHGNLEDNTFHAARITFNTDYRRLGGIPWLEFRGYVTDLQDGSFNLDGVPVLLSEKTQFIGGVRQDLDSNDQVRARGYFDKNFVVQAETLEYITAPAMQSFARITDIERSFEFGYIGAATVGDFTYWIRPDTRLIGDRENRIRFEDLRIGDAVYVSAFSADDKLIASSFAVDNRETFIKSVDIEGGVYAVDYQEKQFFIFSRRIQTSDETEFSEMGEALTQEEFYRTMIGRSVRVRGPIEEGVLIAKTAQVSGNSFFNGFNMPGPTPSHTYWGMTGFVPMYWPPPPYY